MMSRTGIEKQIVVSWALQLNGSELITLSVCQSKCRAKASIMRLNLIVKSVYVYFLVIYMNFNPLLMLHGIPAQFLRMKITKNFRSAFHLYYWKCLWWESKTDFFFFSSSFSESSELFFFNMFAFLLSLSPSFSCQCLCACVCEVILMGQAQSTKDAYFTLLQHNKRLL